MLKKISLIVAYCSPEQTMQVPSATVAIEVNPQLFILPAPGNEVIPIRRFIIPPAAEDPLTLGIKPQPPVVTGLAPNTLQLPRFRQKP